MLGDYLRLGLILGVVIIIIGISIILLYNFKLSTYNKKNYDNLYNCLNDMKSDRIKLMLHRIVFKVSINPIKLSASVWKEKVSGDKIVISFSSKLVSIFYKSNKSELVQLLGHELAHIENGEFRRKTTTDDDKVLQIIEEVSADIVGKNIMRLSDKQIVDAFKSFKKINGEYKCLKRNYYYCQYPPYFDREKFSLNYDSVTMELINYLIDDYKKKYPKSKLSCDLYDRAIDKYCGRK